MRGKQHFSMTVRVAAWVTALCGLWAVPTGAFADPSGSAAADPPGEATSASASKTSSYAPGMLTLRHGELTLQPSVRIEMRAGLLTGDNNQRIRGDLAERPGFGIPRARLGAQGHLTNEVTYAIVTDLAAAQSGALAGTGGALTDAWIGYERYRFAKMWFGVRTVPFAYSAILSSSDSGLSERSRSADAMAPFRQVGLTLGGDYGLANLSWRLGIYNGFDRQGSFYQGIESPAGTRGNRFHGFSGVGRLQVQPLGKVGPSVADLEGGKLRLSVGGGAYVNDSGAAWTTGQSADLHLKVAGAHLLLEWIRDTAEPVQAPTTAATLSETIKRQAMSAEVGMTRGKLGIALRADLVDPNLDIDNNDDELWLSAAVTWHFIANMSRIQLQYDHRHVLNGTPYDNDTLLAKIAMRY